MVGYLIGIGVMLAGIFALGVVLFKKRVTPRQLVSLARGNATRSRLRHKSRRCGDLSGITQADCDAVAELLNRRPRKILGYRTPIEIYSGHNIALTA